jgi:small-conductance mechanosensitive channel
MDPNRPHRHTYKYIWRRANIRLIPCALLFIAGAYIASANGGIRAGHAQHKLIALFGVFVFVMFANMFLRIFTRTIYRLISKHHLSAGRAAAMQFILRIIGYGAIFLSGLDLLGVPVGKLLLGGAAVGIILGVAAQQALGNLFASIVLIVSHPFYVGETITLVSGGLGGTYTGVIKDIGLTHTRLQDKKGDNFLFPNAALLSGATVVIRKPVPRPSAKS